MYAELTTVVDEARLMIHRSIAAIEQLHDGSGVSVPMRAVLEFLRSRGDHTVAATARARSVSRQHIQTIVNDLLAVGMVERIDNPDHARAPLIRLTDLGASTIDEMHVRERSLLEPALAHHTLVTREGLAAAADILHTIGEAFQGLAERKSQ